MVAANENKPLREDRFSEKLFYTAFLLLTGVGYLMALTYLDLTHQGHDGKPGLSVEDIAETYYGNRSGTRLEAAIRGPMSGYLDREGRHHIVAWLKSGAPRETFGSRVLPVLQRDCLGCHSPASGMPLPDLSRYEAVRVVAKVDTGTSLLSLVRLSHIHLFGIGLVIFGVGMIFRRVVLWEWLKGTLLVLPFIAIAVDILAWYLTHWDPHYALTVVITGVVLGLCLAAQILISLYQIWFPGRWRNDAMRQGMLP